MHRRCSLLLLVVCFGLADLAPAQQAPAQSQTGRKIACADGFALGFSCGNVNLSAYLSLADLNADFANDIWGWTDPETGRDYALVGLRHAVAFVDVTEPVNPRLVGSLTTHAGATSVWRDMKVYKDHVFVVVDGSGSNGMQVFDLTQLRAVVAPPAIFSETAHYDGVAQAHNIAINEATGFAYIVGANEGGRTCGGGLHMVNIQDPRNPSFAGCFADPFTGRGTGYTHDAQCVVYHGPDVEHQGKEICFGANVTAVSIADVTDKESPVALSWAAYPAVGYAHQGWLTEDHRYYVLNDELDELRFPEAIKATRTLIWDVSDLDDPILHLQHSGEAKSIDHNLYIVGDYVFQANYTSGLRILDIGDINNPREVAFFDTVPGSDEQQFSGAWSVYPFFESGTIIVSSTGEGLFIVEPTNLRLLTATEPASAVPASFVLSSAYPNPFNPRTALTLTLEQAHPVRVAAYDLLGREVALLHDGMLSAGDHALTFEARGLPSGPYLIKATGPSAVQTQIVTLAK